MKSAVISAALVVLTMGHVADAAEVRIPRSVQGDKGKYYLLERTTNGGIITAVSRRDGVDSVVFTRTETNCKAGKMRVLGESETSIKDINNNSTRWFDLVPGSSKSDLFNYLCKK
ncbi:hypothetical protein [Achromobacter xylosoxidans]|uniref:hypothetical protein n=1 Tax=Alcaligenes xylosoxydans xylosoxydans TaxID=85698 RepID=UPI0006C029C4|nr:hypothetical protein [Achromobacter xylosoxidans]MCH4573830.1 hypothetical protein [Achromobacter xylosoxidans]MDD7987753.1 hypothetical protein [Achromobacter xylosoxidans]OMG78284.1 hypothetical protein BIZ53_16855 [Achromobacter xylosoxidans]CUI36154.1 Uncharacterised protein [Achromobacter xylosoxidans]CUJ95707.1 Uncharacterised protein [Achromobacter xylosoxidans]